MIFSALFGTSLLFGSAPPTATPPSASSSTASPTAAEDPSAALGPAQSPAPSALAPLPTAPVAPLESNEVAPEDGGPVDESQPGEVPPVAQPESESYQVMKMEEPAPGAPLPTPKPPVDPETIAKGPWRGDAWFSLLGSVSFPLAGDRVARGDGEASLGGFFQGGLRPLSWLGVGAGIGMQPHRRYGYDDGVSSTASFQRITFLDLPIIRAYLPTNNILSPFAEAYAGATFLERAWRASSTLGAHGGAGIGLDLWVARNVSLSASARYRVIAIDGEVGHQLAGLFGFTIHR